MTKAPKKQGQGHINQFFSRFKGEDGSIETKPCATCQRDLEITNKNYWQTKKSPDGTETSTTCRSCYAKARHEKGFLSAEIEERRKKNSAKYGGGRKPFDGYSIHPTDDREAFFAEVAEKVQAFHKLDQHARPAVKEKEKLRSEINAAVLLEDDPMEGGQQTDPEIAFYAFIEVIRLLIINFKPFGAVHHDIIQALLSTHPAKVVTCSRGVGKSTLANIYVTWLLYRNPWSEQILVTSKTDGHAKKFIGAIRQYISQSPLLRIMEPDDDQTDNANRVVLKQAKNLGMGQSLTAVSSTGQAGTGSRARVCIADDIETKDHKTPEHVDALEEIVDEYSFISGPFADAQTVILGTPWSQYSLLGRLSRRPEVWQVHISPVFEEDSLNGKAVYHSRWPEGFPDDKINEIKAKTTAKMWRLQMALDLSETEDAAQPIKLAALPVIKLDPLAPKAPVEIHGGGQRLVELYDDATDDPQDGWFEVVRTSDEETFWTSTVAVVDPAGALIGSKNDDVGLVIGSSAGPNVILRFAKGIRGYSTSDIINRVASEVQRHRCTKVIVEENQNAAWALQLQNALSERGYPMTVDTVPTGRAQKFQRILNSLVPNLASGRVFVCKDALKGESGQAFTIQLCGIREEKRQVKLSKDDIVDAFARLLDEFEGFLGSAASSHVAGAKVDYEALSRMSLRRNALNEEELEYWACQTEEEYDLQYKLDHLLAVQRQEVAQGNEDPALARRIEALKKDIAKLQGGFSQRTTLREFLDNNR